MEINFEQRTTKMRNRRLSKCQDDSGVLMVFPVKTLSHILVACLRNPLPWRLLFDKPCADLPQWPASILGLFCCTMTFRKVCACMCEPIVLPMGWRDSRPFRTDLFTVKLAQAFCGEWLQYLKSTAFELNELFWHTIGAWHFLLNKQHTNSLRVFSFKFCSSRQC